jgi:hypothetical protein
MEITFLKGFELSRDAGVSVVRMRQQGASEGENRARKDCHDGIGRNDEGRIFHEPSIKVWVLGRAGAH